MPSLTNFIMLPEVLITFLLCLWKPSIHCPLYDFNSSPSLWNPNFCPHSLIQHQIFVLPHINAPWRQDGPSLTPSKPQVSSGTQEFVYKGCSRPGSPLFPQGTVYTSIIVSPLRAPRVTVSDPLGLSGKTSSINKPICKVNCPNKKEGPQNWKDGKETMM